MVATLYDASLDQYRPHHWMHGFGVFRREYSRVHAQFENGMAGFQHILGGWPHEYRSAELTYRHYPDDITQNLQCRPYELIIAAGGGERMKGPYIRRVAAGRDMEANGMMADAGGEAGESQRRPRQRAEEGL
jgi:hypothetical protein